MLGLFTDVRKMAIASGFMLLLALLFADRGGMADKAVEAGERAGGNASVAASQPSAAQASRANAAWLAAAASDEGEPEFDTRQANDARPGEAPSNPEEVRPSMLTGPDFPPGLTRPGQHG